MYYSCWNDPSLHWDMQCKTELEAVKEEVNRGDAARERLRVQLRQLHAQRQKQATTDSATATAAAATADTPVLH